MQLDQSARDWRETPSDDVYGDDQPDRVAALYQAAFDWFDRNESEGRRTP